VQVFDLLADDVYSQSVNFDLVHFSSLSGS
jgi:hypothetical protein